MKGIKHKNTKIKVKLSNKDRKLINQIIKKGENKARTITRARVLDLFDKNFTSPQIKEVIGCTAETARSIAKNYLEGGLEKALYDAPRPGKARLLSEKESTHIIAMVCSDPPDGRARWTIELIVEEAIKRKIVPTVGRETIRILLITHDLKPWREKNVVHSLSD